MVMVSLPAQPSPLHNSPSLVAGQAAFPPHAQSLPHSKKAALALPIHSLSLSFLPYNSPTQIRLYTQHASIRLCDYINTTNHFLPNPSLRTQSKCLRLLLPPSVRPELSGPRRTPTLPSAACLPICSLPTNNVGKLLGERWKALNEKQRAPYEAKAAADKKRYEDEKQAYNADQEEEESS
ncbi:hypothetical protein FPSE5266_00047 [Fusarium pseudograminearum]|nr:hypothetical protein FPSE5266_00047 [Fusarium pseudograminearum]